MKDILLLGELSVMEKYLMFIAEYLLKIELINKDD